MVIHPNQSVQPLHKMYQIKTWEYLNLVNQLHIQGMQWVGLPIVTMQEQEGATKVSVTFDLEKANTKELQRGGWQAILDNFKKYVEAI